MDPLGVHKTLSSLIFGSFLKSRSIFSWSVLGSSLLLSNRFDVAFRTTLARASAFGTIFGVAELFVPPHRIMNCGFWLF